MKTKTKSAALRGSHANGSLAEATPRRRRSRRSHGQMPIALRRHIQKLIREARRRSAVYGLMGEWSFRRAFQIRADVLVELLKDFPAKPRKASARCEREADRRRSEERKESGE